MATQSELLRPGTQPTYTARGLYFAAFYWTRHASLYKKGCTFLAESKLKSGALK